MSDSDINKTKITLLSNGDSIKLYDDTDKKY